MSRKLEQREHIVGREVFARPVEPAASMSDWLAALPDVLAVRQLRGLAEAIVTARKSGAPVVWAFGGHMIKVGLAPWIARLIERGYVQAIALNGAAAIHDWEIAAAGKTSEDVESGLADGSFGDSDETGRAFARAAAEGSLGRFLGRQMIEAELPHLGDSVLACATRAKIPVTVHVAIGCDTIHTHPKMDGAALGSSALEDFRRFTQTIAGLQNGVFLNCGSAVQLPEVFLKALTAARRSGGAAAPFTTANLDMMRHYRTDRNVLQRPVAGGGQSFQILGHHELNLPLLATAILDAAG